MKSFAIKRVSATDEYTPGVILDGNVPFALTMELPWRNNEKDVSCIPPGIYLPFRVTSPRFGGTFQIPVPGRDGILFHKGNVSVDDSTGCILVGEQFEPVDTKYGIWHSGKGFKEFMDRLSGVNEFQLTILTV